TVTVAVYVPAASPEMSGVRVSVDGAVAVAGVTVSQLASSETLTSSEPVPALITEAVCAGGFGPPCVALKARVDGETESAGGGGGATVSVTVTDCGEPPAEPA